MNALDMGERSTRVDFQPQIDIDFAERLLGRRQRTTLSRKTSMRLQDVKQNVRDCFDSQVCYSIYPLDGIEQSQVRLDGDVVFRSRKLARSLHGAEAVVCFIATVGPDIDQVVNELMEVNALANASIADALGSGAIEQLANSFQEKIERDLRPEGRVCGLRFSPGYCDWPITEQPKLFSLVDGHSIGVHLDDSCLMTPRKSISAVFGIYPEALREANSHTNPCRHCGKKDCIARRPMSQTPS